MMSDWPGWLYVAAVLIPLAAFAVELIGGRWLGRLNAIIATLAIGLSFLLSLAGFVLAAPTLWSEAERHEAAVHATAAEPESGAAAAHAGHEANARFPWVGRFRWIELGGGIQLLPDTKGGPPPAPAKPNLAIPLGIHIDGLAVIMFLMITFIATLIHVYSIGYMHDDPRYPRFFTYLSLFCFSMLLLVASANIFMVFMGWELVGLCSYLLIGFWYEDKKNADAANKAFVVNRVGDVGMLIGLGIIWASLGTFNIAAINRGLSDEKLRDDHGRLTRLVATDDVRVTIQDPDAGGATTTREIPFLILTVAGFGIFAGCVGKSAQTPLHVWLPDAMAGPTPVSALIHAATMVAAGVYLVGRFYPLFTEDVLIYIGYTGGVTLFIAATIAMVQTDYKKVLAYSTVSQLGYMMLGLGVGGWGAGLFHLLTHAFFKALLFLGAGSIYHAVHTYEMPVLGGLRHKMPITAYTMLAATLAISGVPLFSGFYSKDAILGNALYYTMHHPNHVLLFVLPAFGALLTAFYMFRLWFLVFTGEPRGYPARAEESVAVEHGHAHDHGHGHGNPYDHAHESPPVMTWPLILLAIPAVVIGYPFWILPFSEPVLERLLGASAPIRSVELGAAKWWAMGGSILIAAAGIALAGGFYAHWRIFKPEAAARRFGPIYRLFVNKWYFDEIYDFFLVRPTLWLAGRCVDFDRTIIDGVVNGSAGLTVVLSKMEGFFDRFAVDGLVNAVAWVVYGLGDWGRMIQTGRLRSYLALLAVAVVGLFVGVYYWIQA